MAGIETKVTSNAGEQAPFWGANANSTWSIQVGELAPGRFDWLHSKGTFQTSVPNVLAKHR
eukprot:972215-Prorocentrum_lima.AAC.1